MSMQGKKLMLAAGVLAWSAWLTGCSATPDAGRAPSGVKPAQVPVSSSAPDAPGPGVADRGTYLAPLAEELVKTWPDNRTVNIVCHGHSVPAGYFRTPRVDTFNSYPHLLHVGLNERYPNAVVNVIVTAIGGEASPAGAARFERDVLTHRPDLVLIDYALNDRGVGLERAESAWRSMIESAQARGIPVILLTPTAALRAAMDDPADPLNRHAALVRDLAEAYGVGLVDSDAGFKASVADGTDLRDLMSSGVHPNRAGHEIVAERLMRWFPE